MDTITITRGEAYDLYGDLVYLEHCLEVVVYGEEVGLLAERLIKSHIASVKSRRLALLAKLEGKS